MIYIETRAIAITLAEEGQGAGSIDESESFIQFG